MWLWLGMVTGAFLYQYNHGQYWLTAFNESACCGYSIFMYWFLNVKVFKKWTLAN